MTEPITLSPIQLTLYRLLKGTLIVVIACSYLAILSLIFIRHEWHHTLIAGALLVLSHLFRLISNGVDRTGWQIVTQDAGSEMGESAKRFHRWLQILLVLLTLSPIIALMYQTYSIETAPVTVAVCVALIVLESFYRLVSQINRKIEFAAPIFGYTDAAPGPSGLLGESTTQKGKEDELTRRLETLKSMSEQGEISEKAYQKARDKYLVKHVMKKDN